MGFPSGSGLCTYNAAFCKPDGNYRLRLELYIDSTRGQATNKETFDRLQEHRHRVEEELGELEWDRMDNRKASRVSLYFPDGIQITDEDRWPEARDWLIDAMGRMRQAFDPAIQSL